MNIIYLFIKFKIIVYFYTQISDYGFHMLLQVAQVHWKDITCPNGFKHNELSFIFIKI